MAQAGTAGGYFSSWLLNLWCAERPCKTCRIHALALARFWWRNVGHLDEPVEQKVLEAQLVLARKHRVRDGAEVRVRVDERRREHATAVRVLHHLHVVRQVQHHQQPQLAGLALNAYRIPVENSVTNL